MAYSYNEVIATGSPQLIAVPDYIDQAHIKVSLNAVDTTNFSWANTNTVSVTAPAGTKVRVYRDSSPAARVVDYMDGQSLTEVVLDNDSKQAFFLAQEQLDRTSDILALSGNLQTALGTAQTYSQNASTAAGNAATSASNAAASEGNALSYRNAAQQAASDATTNATAVMARFAGRNRFRNPRMEVAQRGTSPGTYGNGTGALYTLDGWRCAYITGGGVLSITQQPDVMASSEVGFSLRATVTTAFGAPAAGQYFNLGQPIEGFLVRDMVGQPIALRFEVRSPKAGQHYVSLRNAGLDRSCILPFTVAAANTWQLVTLTLPGGLITAGTWNLTSGVGVYVDFPLQTGSTFQTATTGSWVTGNFMAGTGQQNLLDTVGNIFAIAAPQIERGTVSSSFEHRDIASEMVLNQRYFETSFIAAQWTNMLAGGVAICSAPWRVWKRANPTTTLSINANTNFSSITVRTSDALHYQVQGTNATGATANFLETYVYGNAEL